MRLHWQSTVDELPDLQQSMYILCAFLFLIVGLLMSFCRPQAIAAYEQAASAAGLTAAQIDQLQTANASPVGGHWSVAPFTGSPSACSVR